MFSTGQLCTHQMWIHLLRAKDDIYGPIQQQIQIWTNVMLGLKLNSKEWKSYGIKLRQSIYFDTKKTTFIYYKSIIAL